MAQISREQFNFSDKFQDSILACMIKRHEFSQYASIISPKYFSSPLATMMCRCLLKHFEKYNQFPSKESSVQLLCDEAKRNGEDEQEAMDYVDRLITIKVHDWKFVHDKVVTFCREREVLTALKKSIEHFKKGEEPPGGYVKLFEKALQVGVGLDDLGLVLNTDYAATIKKVTAVSYGITSGFPVLDQVWRNGWKPGWLVVPLAPPKRFKSSLCINMALNQCRAGYDVVYYACEISQELAAIRALQSLSGMTEDHIYSHPQKFIDSLATGMKQLKGRFLFKGYPSKTTKISDIEAHFNATVATYEDFDPRVAYIDYAETVLASDSGGKISEHQQHASVYTDARAFAGRSDIVVVMPDRCNAETVEMKVPSMKSFQGAFQKAGIVDVAFGLCATEEEYQQGILRYFIFLNRHGLQYEHFQGRVEPDKMRLYIDKKIPYVAEESGSGKRDGRGNKHVTIHDDDDDDARVANLNALESKK